MKDKPRDPHPYFVKKVMKKILPKHVYQSNFGRHENVSHQTWTHFAKQVSDNGTIIDVGAFEGEYSILARMANPTAHIIAFEPNPTSVIQLRTKTKDYDVKVEEIALANSSGYRSFSDNSRTSQLCEGDGAFLVETKTLDEYCLEKQLNLELMKIDTEGAETEILQGCQDLLMKYKPIIICEVLTNSAGLSVMEILSPTYLFFKIDENKGLFISSVVDRQKWRNMNWLFLPKTETDRLNGFKWKREFSG